MIVMSIILTLILLGVIVLIHESGHFFMAKFFKMPVFEFAIGMGPKIFSRKKGETVYSIRALPLGGFVNIGGMQPEEFDFENFKREKIDEIAEILKEEEDFKNLEAQKFNEYMKKRDKITFLKMDFIQNLRSQDLLFWLLEL